MLKSVTIKWICQRLKPGPFSFSSGTENEAKYIGTLYLSIELQSDMGISVSRNSGFHSIKLVEVWWKVSFQDEVILFLLGSKTPW